MFKIKLYKLLYLQIFIFISCSNVEIKEEFKIETPLKDYSPISKAVEIDWITDGDLSGVTLNHDSQTLYFIENKFNTIWEADTNMNLIRTIQGNGFGDSEDLIYLGNNEFGIVNEAGNLFIGIIPISQNNISIKEEDFQRIKFMDHNGNKGPEGVAYDFENNHFFFVKEKNPMEFYFFQRPSSDENFLLINPTIPFNAENWNGVVVTDLSGVTFDNRSGRVLVLSHESRKVLDINFMTGEIMGLLSIPEMIQAEGISFYNKSHDIIIVSEPNFYSKYKYLRN